MLYCVGRGAEVPREEDLRGVPRLGVPLPGDGAGSAGDDGRGQHQVRALFHTGHMHKIVSSLMPVK